MTSPPFSESRPAPISDRTWVRAGIVLLVLYVLAGIVYSFLLPPTGRISDEKEYLAFAHNLLHGPGYSLDGVHLTASRPPGYAFFLAGLEALGAGVHGIRVVHFFLVAATILLTCRLCDPDRRYAGLFLVTALVWIYPVLFYTAGTLYPQTLAAFLFVAALVQFLAAKDRPLLCLTTGFTFGALILAVPPFGPTFAVVLIVAKLLKMIRWRDGLLMILASVLIVGSWTIRNAVDFHVFLPFSSNSGANFLIGNSENTVPYGGSGNIDRTHYQREADALGLNEFQKDHFYQQAAVHWITTHPVRAFVLYLEKSLNFFSGWNEYAPENGAEMSVWKQVVMAATYALLLGLLIWRLAELRRFPPSDREKLFLAVYVLSAFTLAIFFTRIRHRLPYDYLIIAVIAMHLGRHLRRWLHLPPTSKKAPRK